MTYSEKLKTREWKRVRTAVLIREDHTCEDCGATDEHNQVHHAYYIPDTDPWDYPLESLHCLCPACHAARERAITMFRATIGDTSWHHVLPFAESLANAKGKRKVHNLLEMARISWDADEQFLSAMDREVHKFITRKREERRGL